MVTGQGVLLPGCKSKAHFECLKFVEVIGVFFHAVDFNIHSGLPQNVCAACSDLMKPKTPVGSEQRQHPIV